MVESALIDVESKDKLYDLQGNGEVEDIVEESINLFINAIEETNNLRIVGTSFNKAKREIFLIEDINNSSGHIEVVISEIIEKVKNMAIAREFVKVIMGERSPIILNGITRIVGYFSRVNNWNRSKIGELKDRRMGEYSVSIMKVYFDNDVSSAISRRDLKPEENTAIDSLLKAKRSGKIYLGTSHQSPREMERAPSVYQANLKKGLAELDLTKDDHKVLGFHTQTDQYGGCISNPLVSDIVDEELYQDLLDVGLGTNDAKHLMYAVSNGYHVFLTCDDDHFLSQREKLEKLCPSIRIWKPSELVVELANGSGCKTDTNESKKSA